MSRKLRVLVVEDNPADADLVRETLSDHPEFEISHVSLLAEALVRVRGRQVDLVLLDLGLPDSQGLSTYDHLREAAPDLPIVLLTGNGDRKAALAAVRSGAQGFLVKGRGGDTPLAREILYAMERKKAVEEIEVLSRLPAEAPSPVLRIGIDGKLIYANPSAQPLLKSWGCEPGGSVPADWAKHVVDAMASGVQREIDVDLGNVSIVFTLRPVQAAGYLNAYGYDNTDRRQTEKRVRVARSVLERLNETASSSETIRDILMLVKKGMDIEAVAIRLREKEDFPYYETDGFPDHFVEMERHLCARDETGHIVRDEAGQPVLECMCGNILCGRTDCSKPFFTEGGSFWSNCTTDLLASTTDKDRGAHTRNNCNKEGYESVALIPLRSGGETIGLLQLNDRRRDRFTPEMISFLEGLGASIGIALARKRAEVERGKLEEQLRQAQKMEAIGRLAGGVAHDFNNALTVIIGFADLLLMNDAGVKTVRQRIGSIRMAAEHAATLTKQLLAFSRKQVLQPRLLNLGDTAAETEQMIRRLVGEDVEVTLAVDPAAGMVMADPGQIGQVIMNLAVNARDAMPGGGRLVIEVANADRDQAEADAHTLMCPGSYVMLAVSDTGTGMDAETKARIFEPFFTTKAAGSGTGLGLSTVYGIVKQSGGTISVYSEVGHGTTFKIYLPRVEGPVPVAAVPAKPVAVPVHVRPATILVVEDEEGVRSLVSEILEGAGHHIVAAASPEHALAIGLKIDGGLDLLLTDMVMPGMTGKELATRLLAKAPNLRLLFMSGYTAQAAGQQQLLQPGDAFIQKPFTSAALLAKVREALA